MMLSLLKPAINNAMLLYRINSISVTFDCDKSQLDISYTRAGKPESRSIPFADIEQLFAEENSAEQPISSTRA